MKKYYVITLNKNSIRKMYHYEINSGYWRTMFDSQDDAEVAIDRWKKELLEFAGDKKINFHMEVVQVAEGNEFPDVPFPWMIQQHCEVKDDGKAYWITI